MDFCFPSADDSAAALQDLHLAAMLGQLDDLARMIDDVSADSNLINASDSRGCAAIHHAALGTSAETILLLLERGADIHARTASRATALHLAAFNGRVAICKLLVLHGSDVNAKDADERTPLYDARFALLGTPACPCSADTPDRQPGKVAAFLERVLALSTASSNSSSSSTSAEAFVRRSWELFVSELLQKALEVDPLLREDEAGRRHQDRLRSMTRLLTYYRRHVDARDYDGSSALHAAALAGPTDAARLLLDHGACVNVTTNYQDTPLHLAAKEGRLEVAELLVARGADVNATNRFGSTPLDVARRARSSDVVIAFLEAERMKAPVQVAAAVGRDCMQSQLGPHPAALAGSAQLEEASEAEAEAEAEAAQAEATSLAAAAGHTGGASDEACEEAPARDTGTCWGRSRKKAARTTMLAADSQEWSVR